MRYIKNKKSSKCGEFPPQLVTGTWSWNGGLDVYTLDGDA